MDEFGAAPAVLETSGERCIISKTSDGRWVVREARGLTPFEKPPRAITDVREAQAVLSSHDWQCVGYTIVPTAVEVFFDPENSGRSRFYRRDTDKVVPTVREYFWEYRLEENRIIILWDAGHETVVTFRLAEDLRTVGKISGKGIGIFRHVWHVDRHPFPDEQELVHHFPKEYWSTPFRTRE